MNISKSLIINCVHCSASLGSVDYPRRQRRQHHLAVAAKQVGMIVLLIRRFLQKPTLIKKNIYLCNSKTLGQAGGDDRSPSQAAPAASGDRAETKSPRGDRRRPVLLQQLFEYAVGTHSKSTKAGRRGVWGRAPVLRYGVMVAQQILVLFVQVRILISQLD